MSALHAAQLEVVGSAGGAVPVLTVPLAHVCGRVLAEPIPPEPMSPLLPAGTLLDATHIPQLAANKRGTARVYAQTRVGVITLIDDEPGAEFTFDDARATGLTIAAAATRAGAQIFEATCRQSDARLFARTVQMYADKCSLILVAGSVSPLLQAAVRAEISQADCAGAQTHDLRPFGVLQRWYCGPSLMIALSGDSASALATFTLFVTPVMRRLAGRLDIAPVMHAAWLTRSPGDDASDGPLIWVRLHRSVSGPCLGVVPTTRPPVGASGLAWRALNYALQPDIVIYVPVNGVTR